MLVETLYGYKGTQCLYVAAKLNIADHLAQGNKSTDELARLTHTHSDALYRVLRCLASLGIFEEKENRLFALNKSAEPLLTDSSDSIKDFIILCGEELYQAASDLLYSTTTGQPAFPHIYGMSHWEYLEKNPAKAEIFHHAMDIGSRPIVAEIIANYDFSNCRTIIDVGGGKGLLTTEILAKNPNLHGIVFDLENATKLAAEYIAQKDIANRCDIVAGDFLKISLLGWIFIY